MLRLSGSTKSLESADPTGRKDPRQALLEALAGEVIVTYGRGKRVLDLGAASPQIATWIEQATPIALEQWPKSGVALPRDVAEMRLPYSAHQFDLAFCFGSFFHLGQDEDNSRDVAIRFLEESARVLRPGGHLLLHAHNALSLRGVFIRAGRSAHDVARGIVGAADDEDETVRPDRWDSLAGFVRMLPPELELVEGHGLGVLTVSGRILHVPLLGRAIRALEWQLRDSKTLRHLAGDILAVIRRSPISATTR